MANVDYAAIFKKIYYHLYSNSSSSRAEKLLDDVTKLLLYSYAVSMGETNGVSLSRTDIFEFLKEKYEGADYQASPFALDDKSIAAILPELLTLDLRNAPAHIVGDAVQSMIGPRIRGDKGQFFTPESLVRAIVEIVGVSPGELMADPACGTGGFISSAYSASKDFETPASFVGVDKDRDMANLAFAVTEVEASGRSSIHCANSLEYFKEENPLHDYVGKIDAVITNPPFGAKIGITDKEVLSAFDLGHVWTQSKASGEWHKTSALPRKQDPQVLFIELCVKLLKENGRMGIVLPEGIFYSKNQGYIWHYLLERGRIVALLDCPRNTFQPSTDTKTNVLIYEKGSPQTVSGVWFAQAKSCGHDRRGRTSTSSGEPIADDFISVAQNWHRREEADSGWVYSTPDGGLYIPRYYVNKAPRPKNESTTTLGELIDKGFLSIRSGHEVGSDAYGTGDIPYVRTSDINNFEVSCDPTNSVSEDVYNRYKAQENLKPGDILFIADGRYRIGKTAIITEHNAKCVVQSHIDILTLTDDAPLAPYELLYLLGTAEAQSQVSSLVFISSTLGTIGNRIREIRLPLPKRDDSWNDSIARFESLINGRAAMLAELRSYDLSQDD